MERMQTAAVKNAKESNTLFPWGSELKSIEMWERLRSERVDTYHLFYRDGLQPKTALATVDGCYAIVHEDDEYKYLKRENGVWARIDESEYAQAECLFTEAYKARKEGRA